MTKIFRLTQLLVSTLILGLVFPFSGFSQTVLPFHATSLESAPKTNSGPVHLISKTDPMMFASATGGENTQTAISADGRFTVFESQGANLTSGQIDVNNLPDVFLFDRMTGKTILVSHRNASSSTTANDRSGRPIISADGNFVVFVSAGTDLVAGQIDTNDVEDLFLYSRLTGEITLVSRIHVSPVTTGSGLLNRDFVTSADGRYVAFSCTSPEIAQVEKNFGSDVFLFDRLSGEVTLVSHERASLTTTGNAISLAPAISADGQRIAYQSSGTDLVAEYTDANNVTLYLHGDIFLFDRKNGTTHLVSRSMVSPTVSANSDSASPRLSADGKTLVFQSSASDVVEGDFDLADDVFWVSLD